MRCRAANRDSKHLRDADDAKALAISSSTRLTRETLYYFDGLIGFTAMQLQPPMGNRTYPCSAFERSPVAATAAGKLPHRGNQEIISQ